MSELIITANGEYVLPDGTKQIRTTATTSVMIKSNTATAVCEFGYGDESDTFKAFTNGIVSTDQLISHGRGCKLMVKASGISSGEVTIFHFPVGV